MFTRNYDITREYMTICQAKIPEHQCPYIVNYQGLYSRMYEGSGNGMGFNASCLCNNWVTINYNSLGRGTMTLEIGSGTTMPTYDDYTLESPIVANRKKINIQYPYGGYKIDYDTNIRTLTVRYIIQNTGTEPLNINEYGIYSYISYNGTYGGTICLIYREVLDETVILQPDDIYSFDFTYTTEFYYPILDKYGYITDTWEEIVENINSGNHNYQLGQVKGLSFTLDDINYSIKMKIVGIEQDDLAEGGKVKTTWMAERPLFNRAIHSANPTQGSNVGWGTTNLRNYLNSDFLSAIVNSYPELDPSNNGIKLVNKKYTTGTSTTLQISPDYIFIPSNSEVGVSAESTSANYGPLYGYFDSTNKKKNIYLSSTYPWLRSINTYRKNFSTVYPAELRDSTDSATANHSIIPLFCI